MYRRTSKKAASKKLAICCTLASASALAAVGAACSSNTANGFGGASSSGSGSGGGTTTSSSGGGGGSSGGGSGGGSSDPCTTTIACNSPSLDVLFSPMYSAYITDDSNAHSFQIPAVVKGVSTGTDVTWGVSDPTAVACQTDSATGGVMITVLKPSNVTIVAQTSAGCGQSVLNVTTATDSQWQTGNARYNNHVPIYGGCIGLNKNYPDGGASACPAEGPACIDCHGKSPKNPFFNGVLHTPEQTGGFSDEELIGIFTDGVVPDGGYFNSSIVSPLSFSVFHRWQDIQGADQQAMVVYLRSLEPVSQGGANFGGGLDDGGTSGGGSDDAGSGESTSPTCGATTCTAGDVCCVQPSDKTDAGLVGTCGAASSCTGFALSCTYTADCPAGQYCCGNLGGSPATASCQTSCSADEDQLCKTASECPSGDGCRAYAFGDGIKVCLEKTGDGGKAAKKDGG